MYAKAPKGTSETEELMYAARAVVIFKVKVSCIASVDGIILWLLI